MAQITIDDVTVTLPDVIPNHAGNPELSLAGTTRVINCLNSYLENLKKEGRQFPVEITETLKSGKGGIKISYTGTATAAKPDFELGGVNPSGHQGGDHWLVNRTANYTISIDYYIDQKSYPLLKFAFNNTTTNTTKTNYQKKKPEFHEYIIKGHQSQANTQNAVALGTFLKNDWSKSGSDTVSKDYSSDIKQMLMQRTIEETKKAKEEAVAQAARAKAAAAQAEQKRAAEEIARKLAEAEVHQANRIKKFQTIGKELALAAVIKQVIEWGAEHQDALNFIIKKFPEANRIIAEGTHSREFQAFTEAAREGISDQEFQAFINSAVSASKEITLALTLEGKCSKTAMPLYEGIQRIESRPTIGFQGEGLTFLGYNNAELQKTSVVEAVEAVTIHAQRVAEALEEEEEPIPPMAPGGPLMMFSQDLQPPAIQQPQPLRVQPQASYNGAAPR